MLDEEHPVADTLATEWTTELLGPDGGFDSWLDGWRQKGQTRAAAGTTVPDLMRESLDTLATLRQQALGDLLPGDAATVRRVQEWDNLHAAAMTALISGYFTGQEQLAETQRTTLAELTALNRINSAANSTLDLDQMLDSVVDHVAAVTRADVCSLFTYEPEIDRLVLRATRGLTPSSVGRVRLRLGEGVTGWAARAGKPLALTDGWRDDRFLHVPGLGEERTRAILAVPIVLFTKLKLVGVITLQSYGDRQFAERDVSFLETVAGEVAIAIENARLHRETDERLRQKVAQLTILQGVSASIAATLNLQEVLAMLASEAVHLLGADAAVLYELRDEWLMPTASFGFRPN
jgi:GAF domain-containing protein